MANATSVRRCLLAAVAAGLLTGCAGTPQREEASHEAAERLGVKILGLRQAAAGYMLDLRYTVVDAQKAAPLLERKARPYLLDQETGARLFVPTSAKLGPIRQSSVAPREGQTYFALFANPARHVPVGRKVTLVVGEQSVADLVVGE